MRGFLSCVLALLVAALLAFALWVWGARPVAVSEEWNQKLSSVSFAPFRQGQSPLTKIYPKEEQVAEDLATVASLSLGIRTYTSREGLEKVPELARQHGLNVTFGAWLTSEVEEKGRIVNEAETDALIKAANAFPDDIKRVIVGNEVLLRNDLPPEKLIAYIRKVKAEIAQPVSYADVWAFYLQYPEVGREVDYITIHILPFWEDEPVGIDEVEAHIVKIVTRIREAFPGKPILIGETGWPSLGRDRGPAHVSTVNQARFVRKMARLAKEYDFDYNIVEAFDQPWKAKLENTVGAAWGIWDIDRQPKFEMSGPVSEVADWRTRAIVAISFGVLLGGVAGALVPGFSRKLYIALLAQGLAWASVTACFHAEAVSFETGQMIWAIFRGGIAVLMTILIVWRSALMLGDHSSKSDDSSFDGEALLLLVSFYALIWALLLVFDGRYRDIPIIDFASTAIGGVLLSLQIVVTFWRRGRPILPALTAERLYGRKALIPIGMSNVLWRFLAAALPIAAMLSLIGEGVAITGKDFAILHPTLEERIPLILRAMISNFETNIWALMLAAMAIPAIASKAIAKRSAEGRLFRR